MTKHIPIFLTTDEKYIHYVAITIASVCYNTSAVCEFFILADSVSNFKKKQVNELLNSFDNLKINWIDLTSGDKEYLQKTYLSENQNTAYTTNVANYSRFLLPDLLPNVDRALYIDTDIICRGDIAELYNQSLDGHVIGAVPCSYVMSSDTVREKVAQYLPPSHLYFNAGILLIDCKKWRENKIFTKIAECDCKIRDIKVFNTQDPLNKCFENDYKPLPHKFNWYGDFCKKPDYDESICAYLDENMADNSVVIRHFAGTKPDFCPERFSDADMADFWFFAAKTVFYPEMHRRESIRIVPIPIKKTIRIKLFKCIPLLKIRKGQVYLFGFINILTIRK